MLDECTPRAVKRLLFEHDVATVQELGWSGTRNGKLLRRAEEEKFAVMVTCDKNIESQQNLRERNLAIVVLPTNQVSLLKALGPNLRQVIDDARPGQMYKLEI